jgi:glycosyltransferase involved in cell wall biosynthesis
MPVVWQGQALMIVPTYNERENLARLVERLRGLPGDVHVLVVDDNSPDGTGAIADTLAASDAGVHVLHRAGKQGLGTAYKAGFDYGLEHGFQYICTMDADFSHSPESLPSLLDKAATGYDLVIGSRYVRGGAVVGSPPFRKFISYAANSLAHRILGVEARDCTAGFRCYRREVLEAINLDAIFSSGYSFLIEMAFYCQRAGFRIGEVPITFVNRTEGASKINRREIYKAFYTLLRLRTPIMPWEQLMDTYHRRRDVEPKKAETKGAE